MSAVPANPDAAKFLFDAIAYAEQLLGLLHGSAYPGGSELTEQRKAWTVSTKSNADAWLIPLIPVAISPMALLLRLQVTRTGGHLLAEVIAADTHQSVCAQKRSRHGKFSAIDDVLAAIGGIQRPLFR
jgi:hypothetical protein